ncbi:hypothetical protein FHT09_000119 [Xanthomonas arboricola]|uniref:hypothetical protein n=1 Tax=Xanthomonas TaxID=338 RepID=UPI0015E4618D|nr:MULTISPECIES: hypothetical protein [Xanthomonas]MBB5734420.1 hypothetical protein [Xanthomonas sp. CFBP 8152]
MDELTALENWAAPLLARQEGLQERVRREGPTIRYDKRVLLGYNSTDLDLVKK